MNKTFYTLIIQFLIIGLCVPMSWSKNNTLQGYSELGRRSTAEDYVEEDNDDDYSYYNSNLKYAHRSIKNISYAMSAFYYKKDYISRTSLDNKTKIIKSGLKYSAPKFSETTSKIGLDFEHRQKRFENTPNNEYNLIKIQPSLSFSRAGNYSIHLDFGISSFDYLLADSRDQFKSYGKINGRKNFLDKKLLLESRYKIEAISQRNVNRKRTKQDILGSAALKFNNPLLRKIAFRLNWGQRDAKENELRDEDLDFETISYLVKTEHSIHSRIAADLSFRYLKKDYLISDLDSEGFYINNNWVIDLFNNQKFKSQWNLEGEYKDVAFPLKQGRDFNKMSFRTGIDYNKKKSWNAAANIEGHFYEFDNSFNDRNKYFFLFSVDQPLFGRDLNLGIILKYKITDFKERKNTNHESIRIEFKYKF